MVQTVLIARALGITEYGVYGLLFGTIGLVASVVGLQMGLTATVFVARYRDQQQAQAAAVITQVRRFGWLVAAVILVGLAPFASSISRLLLQSSDYQVPVLLAIVFVGASVVSGVQDGIAKGFEIFKALAWIKGAVAIVVFAAIWPMAMFYGITGVLATVLAGLLVKYLALGQQILKARDAAGIPASGSGISFRGLIAEFALPSMLVSLGTGVITWLGMFLLSRQAIAFDGVAIVNTGLQWRGPVLLLTSAISTVAVPAFSRLHAEGNAAQSARLRYKLAFVSFLIASAVALALTIGAKPLLTLYGDGFASGRWAFSLVVVSTVPMVVAQVYMQQLVGAARMWRQLWLHTPFLAVMAGLFLVLVPRYQALGYAASLLAGALVFVAHTLIADFLTTRRYDHSPNPGRPLA